MSASWKRRSPPASSPSVKASLKTWPHTSPTSETSDSTKNQTTPTYALSSRTSSPRVALSLTISTTGTSFKRPEKVSNKEDKLKPNNNLLLWEAHPTTLFPSEDMPDL